MKQLLILFLCLIPHLACAQTNKTYLLVGTYTDGRPDKGIFIYEFDPENGRLKKLSSTQQITNPSFLTISPDGQYIYACTDTKMSGAGSVSAFRFDSSNAQLTFLNKQNSGGENPVYLTCSPNNEYVINGNYTEGTVSVFPTNSDGSLNPAVQLIQFEGSSVNARRQDKAHIHATVFSNDYRYLFFPDLGTDKIRVYKFEPKQNQPLTAMADMDVATVAGSGPRHLIFHPNNKFVYCTEELSGTIAVFSYENGKLDSIQRLFSYSKLQDEYNSADIHLSPDGLFLYASNRLDNENTISIFAVDQHNGHLTLLGHQYTYGDHPRSFTIDPTGNFLIVANLLSDNIVVFKRNIKTGLLKKTLTIKNVPRPACLKMRKYGT
ncbi:MAG: lactonase family protein [Bacteroidota bacterium]